MPLLNLVQHAGGGMNYTDALLIDAAYLDKHGGHAQAVVKEIAGIAHARAGAKVQAVVSALVIPRDLFGIKCC